MQSCTTVVPVHVVIARLSATTVTADMIIARPPARTVTADTIIVTYYNAPNAPLLRAYYEGLPDKLAAEQIDPRIPWLYNYRLDFRFR